MTARDTAALTAQIAALAAEIDRLKAATEFFVLTGEALRLAHHAGYEQAREDMRPASRGARPRRAAARSRASLSVVSHAVTRGGIA